MVRPRSSRCRTRRSSRRCCEIAEQKSLSEAQYSLDVITLGLQGVVDGIGSVIGVVIGVSNVGQGELDGTTVDTTGQAVGTGKAIHPSNPTEDGTTSEGDRTLRVAVTLVKEDCITGAAVVDELLGHVRFQLLE